MIRNVQTCVIQCLFGLLFMLASATFCLGQNITLKAENQSLATVVQQVAKTYDLHFSYSAEELQDITTSIEAENEPVNKFLARLLAPHGLEAKKSRGNFYFIQFQKVKVYLLVQDAADNTSIPYAAAQIKGQNKGAFADESGKIELLLDPAKDSTLLLSSVGYTTREFKMNSFSKTPVQVTLDYATQDLLAFEVLEYINRAIQIKGDASTFSLFPNEMEVLPGLPEPDALLSTQMLPGFDSNDENASGINVRAGGPDQNLIYWDNIPVYQPAHYFGSITAIMPELVEEITVYKNYIPANFTGATSGLLDLSVYDSVPQKLKVRNHTTLTHSGLITHIPLGQKAGLFLGGRQSYNHLWETPAFNAYSTKLFDGSARDDIFGDEEDEGFSSGASTLRFWDFNGKLVTQLTPKDYLSISTIANGDQLSFAGSNLLDSTNTDQSHTVNYLGTNFTYGRQWNKTWKSQFSVSQASYDLSNQFRERFTEDNEVLENTSNIDNRLDNLELKTSLRYTGFNKTTLEAGYQFNHYENEVRFNFFESFEPNTLDTIITNSNAHGFYVAATSKVGKNLILRPQLRLDAYSLSQSVVLNPILNFDYQLREGLYLKGSFGRYAQALRTLNEEDIVASNTSESVWILADEDDLGLLKSQQFSIGALYSNKGWIIDFDVYHKTTEGLSLINQFNSNLDLDLDFADGSSVTSGFELMLKKRFGRYQSWASYSLSSSESTFEELQEEAFASTFDRPHKFRWVHTVTFFPFELSLGWNYKSGAPQTAANGVILEDEEEEIYRLSFAAINGSRLPDYHRLDFSVWYNFPKPGRKFTGRLGFSLLNLYNRENLWRRFYFLEDTNDDDIPEVETEERYFLGITPNLTLQLRFQ